MELSFKQAEIGDAEKIYELCRQLILDYEKLENIDLEKVLHWVQEKVVTRIREYMAIYADGEKAGYYRFCKTENGEFEIDDLYVFPEFQNRGIGSEVIRRCCTSVCQPVMLYVFIRNQRAVSLYRKFGFEVVQTIKDNRYIMKRVNQPNKKSSPKAAEHY